MVRSSAPGVALDAAATSSVVIRALADGRHTVDVQVRTEQPAIVDADVQDALKRAQGFTTQPFQLTWSDGKAEIAPATLADAVKFTEQPDANPKLAVNIDSGARQDHPNGRKGH